MKLQKDFKERQKELKEVYRGYMSQIWNDKKMIDYRTNEGLLYVPLNDNNLYQIEKLHIKKDFCFGYSDGYSTEDYDRASDMAQHARESESYFLEQNLKYYAQWIDELTEARDSTRWTVYARKECRRQSDECKNVSLVFIDKWHEADIKDDYRVLTADEIDRLIAYYKVAYDLHKDRVLRYLKRYGTRHVCSWTYWRDA